ncbi:hypothetical protein BD408DRAFT_371457 [Parasitella parasitica]|nr:hypothetical protein BD408DRAFT_371457 [Parasitella parasitica]
MSNWNTLNNGLTASVKDAVELQVERLLETYQNTLKLQHKGQFQLAKQKYEELVSHHLVKKEPKPKKKFSAGGSTSKNNISSSSSSSVSEGNKNGDRVEESPLSTLRFLVFKNYASILKDEYMVDPQGNKATADKALFNYLQAVEIDPTDYSLWYFIGYLSQNLHKLRFARLAYETGFYMSDQERALKLPTVRPNDAMRIINSGNFTVMQWRCFENLCQVLYDIGDYRLCSFYVDIALKRHPSWEAGLRLKICVNNGEERAPNIEASTADMHTDQIDTNPVKITIKESDWTLLIKSLLNEHKRLAFQDSSSKKVASDDKADKGKTDALFISHAVQIHVEKDEEAEEEKETKDHADQTQASDTAIPAESIIQDPVLPKEPIVVLEKPNSENATDIDSFLGFKQPKVVVKRSGSLDSSLISEPKAAIKTPDTQTTAAALEEFNNAESKIVESAVDATHQDQQSNAPVSLIIIEDEDDDETACSTVPEQRPLSIPDLIAQTVVPMPLLSLVSNPTTSENDITNDVEMREANSNTLKRKRDDIDDGGETVASQTDKTPENSNDEEEEDEAEEKRLSLRASKRQREKIANEETSRLKMLDEEKLFSDKVQGFYTQVEQIAQLHRKLPWFDGTIDPFWDWFDSKISELDSIYCWDIDTANNTIFSDSNIVIGDNSAVGKSLQLFTTLRPCNDNGNFETKSKTTIRQLITELNSNNSGIIDSLCKLIMTIVSHDLNTQDQMIMSTDMLELVTDTVNQMQSNLIQDILSNAALSQQQRVFIFLRISEYAIDHLIRKTITTLDEVSATTANASKKRMSISLAKQAKLKTLNSLIEQSTFWIHLVEQSIFSLSLDRFCTSETFVTAEDEHQIQLRYCVLKGKLSQCSNDIENAYAWYDKCKTLLDEHPATEIDVGSMYDSFISRASIDKKIELLQVGKLFVTAKQKMKDDDYEGVIQDLQDVVQPKLIKEEPIDSDESVQMITVLAEAYYNNRRYLDAWNCYMRLICCAVKQLVDYGKAQMLVPAFSRPSRNEDVEFTSMLARISGILDALVKLVDQEVYEEWLPLAETQDLMDTLSVLLRMSIYYIFRHPDFVPIVNNFTNPDVPPHAPSKITKMNGFNDILIKSWVLQSSLLQYTLKLNKDSVANNALIMWGELLQQLHDELGEREVCGAAKTIFVQHLMRTLGKADSTVFRREIYQCYHCLYGVHLAAESGSIEEHHCIHNSLGRKAAEPLFALVADAAIEKLKGGSLLKNDLKDVVETVSSLFEDLNTKTHIQLKNNEGIIQTYLNGKLEMYSSLDTMLRTAILPTVDIDPRKIDVSPVLFSIFYIRGKTLRLQIKNRAKTTNDRNMIDLEKAVEEFTSHIILNPNDADGWCELGVCYQLLAAEELNWNASNIIEHNDVICGYQRKSFHAFTRGLYLRNLPSKDAAKNELFSDFGNLVYSIASPPMNMEAFKFTGIRKTLGPDGKLADAQTKIPPLKSAYRLAMVLYNHAIQYKTADRFGWRCYYMAGKCLAKIGRPPTEVLHWYLQAICRTKPKNGRHDHVLEPIYIFYSALVKFLYQGQIDSKTALDFLFKEKSLQGPEEKDVEVVHVGNHADGVTAVVQEQRPVSATDKVLNDLKQHSAHLPVDTANAYNAIFKRITDIRTADSKGWHHRPIYRIAWMYYHVYHQTEEAKSELLNLFSLKGNSKYHVNIWKHGFELPGKHYVYAKKYTLFLIQLAEESNDSQTLKNLYRKLKKAKQLIMNEKQDFRKAYRAFLQITKVHLVSIYHAESVLERIRNARLDKLKFEAICSTFVKALSEDKSLTDPELYAIIQDLAELRRLTHLFISVTDSDDDGLDDAIQMCFAVVAFGGDDMSAKLNEESNMQLDENNGQILLETLSTQAKILMQNTTTTSKMA